MTPATTVEPRWAWAREGLGMRAGPPWLRSRYHPQLTMVPWCPSVVGVKGAVGHTSTGGGDTGHMWLAAPCSFCQLSTVGGAEWQVTAWASLSGQDDHSLPCSSQTSLYGLLPRLEGLSTWPRLAMDTWLCLADPVPGVLPCSLVYLCAPSVSSSWGGSCHPLLEA